MKNLFIFLVSIISLSATAQSFPDSQKDGKYMTVNGAKLWDRG
jgi:proline iminopeptidase